VQHILKHKLLARLEVHQIQFSKPQQWSLACLADVSHSPSDVTATTTQSFLYKFISKCIPFWVSYAFALLLFNAPMSTVQHWLQYWILADNKHDWICEKGILAAKWKLNWHKWAGLVDTKNKNNKWQIQCISEKRHPFYFCDNFVRCHPILLIFGRNIPEEICSITVITHLSKNW